MVFLQVIIDRKKCKIDLGIAWPANKFDLVAYCKPRIKNDVDVVAYNIVISNALAKANNIHKDYLIKDLQLTLDAFRKDYHSNLNKNDFIKYFEKQSYRRWNLKEISDETYEKEEGTLRRLVEFSEGSIPFHTFTSKWAKEWDAWLKRKHKNDHNTRWGRHKHVTTYLNMARDDDKINFNDPYQKFTNKMVESSWGPLELGQLQILIKKYSDWKNNPIPLLQRKNGVKQVDSREGLTQAEVTVLRKFLLSCNNALRISDLQELDEGMFINGEMSLTPNKTERWGTKITSVPLNEIAKVLIADEIIEVKTERDTKPLLRIFERYTDQACNRLLKRIARKSDLKFNLHMHMGRYTFGSLMDEAGANHTALMKLMGIRKRDTLEKYVKTNKARITTEVNKLNDMIAYKEKK